VFEFVVGRDVGVVVVVKGIDECHKFIHALVNDSLACVYIVIIILVVLVIVLTCRLEGGSIVIHLVSAKRWEVDAHVEVFILEAGVEIYSAWVVFVTCRVAHVWESLAKIVVELVIIVTEVRVLFTNVIKVDLAKVHNVGALEGAGRE